jgi:hypothetical protein
MRQKRSNSFPEFRRHERGIRDELDVETRAIGTISLLELLSAFGEATKWRKWGKVAVRKLTADAVAAVSCPV